MKVATFPYTPIMTESEFKLAGDFLEEIRASKRVSHIDAFNFVYNTTYDDGRTDDVLEVSVLGRHKDGFGGPFVILDLGTKRGSVINETQYNKALMGYNQTRGLWRPTQIELGPTSRVDFTPETYKARCCDFKSTNLNIGVGRIEEILCAEGDSSFSWRTVSLLKGLASRVEPFIDYVDSLYKLENSIYNQLIPDELNPNK